MMLLSMFSSFLLVRKFGSRIYVRLVTILIILVSLFSMGLPVFNSGWEYELKYPLPLSLPFYASIEWRGGFPELSLYLLYFLTFEINRSVTPSYFFHGMLFLHYSFFLLVNVVGAVVGYWIGKSKRLEGLSILFVLNTFSLIRARIRELN